MSYEYKCLFKVNGKYVVISKNEEKKTRENMLVLVLYAKWLENEQG